MSDRSINNRFILVQTLRRWFDAHAELDANESAAEKKIDWLRAVPFIALHVSVLFVFFVGWSPVAIMVAVAMYAVRMFAITAFYHRYFSHKAFRTSRIVQFIFAALGASAVQRGPLWWAAHHRQHHVHSDKPGDEHSPGQSGFLWSHMGWFLSRHNFKTRLDKIKDFSRYPELRLLDRFDVVMPVLLAAAMFGLGELLNAFWPELGTNGWQMLVWGFIISTVVLYHITFTINSLAHNTGHRRFSTGDDSRNNFLLAILTFGEGWHNNHHFYPGSARQGFIWHEIDITYYGLRLMQLLGLIRDLRPVPASIMEQRSKHVLNKSIKGLT